MTLITAVANPNLGTPSSLTLPQMRMILRIYWTDRYQREALGFSRSTLGIRARLAKQFGVSIEVIKKLVATRHSRRRRRFTAVRLAPIQRSVQNRMRQQGIPIIRRTVGRPRKITAPRP